VERVKSNDGTAIAFQRSGQGPPLVLVHGTTADHTRWTPVLAALERHFTVYAMDRRGRGKSGDAEPYALEREFEDVAAVVNAAGPRVNLLGHSYGALCAMEAALRTIHLHKLILYEPPFPVEGIQMYPSGAKERLQALLERGDREGLLVTFFRDIVRSSEKEIERLRAEPVWQARLAAAHTLVREMGDADYVFAPERFRSLTHPTLLLLGEKSPPFLKKPTQRLASTLPSSRVVVMSGQGHAAMSTAPELFLHEVIGFLEA
jgi:pimeloyl-ACP methyl ester carboxylesterase